MKEEIKVIECNSISEAESEYFRLREEGCWQMVKCMEIVWSWKKFKTVARFSMKRVEKAYHIDDYIKDLHDVIVYGCTVLQETASVFNSIKKHKAEQRLKKLLEDKL